MRKLITILLSVFFYVVGVAQTLPNYQSFGSPTTLTEFKGVSRSAVGNILTRYADTTTANANAYIKNYAGSQIVVGDTIWFRNSTATTWLKATGAAGGGGGSGTVQSFSIVTANGFSGSVANSTTTPALTITTTITGLLKGNGTAISAAVAGTDYLTPTGSAAGLTSFPTLNQNTTGSAATLTTGRTIGITGDLVWTSPSFNGSANVTAAGTLATVNSNVGSFGSATQSVQITANAKGLITAISNVTITPAVGSITGLGTGVGTALAINVGSAGSFVTFNGALGTPSSGTLTNATGLPITTGTTGTLGFARGGTGLTTLGTDGQQLRVNTGATALEYFTPSASVAPLFPTTGTGTATGAVIGALAGNTFNINQGANAFLSIDPTANNETVTLQAYNTTGGDNVATFNASVTDVQSAFTFNANFDGGAELASIDAFVNSSLSSLTYTADTHTFNGAGIWHLTNQSFAIDDGGLTVMEYNTTAKQNTFSASDGTNTAYLQVTGSVGGGQAKFYLSAIADVDPEIYIEGDAITNTIEYEALNHVFEGAVRLNTLAGNGAGIVAVDNDGDLSFLSGPAVGSITGLGTGVATALAINVGSAGAFVTFNGAGGTPSSLTLTNATGLPVGSITGLGTGVATWLATPSSANLLAALTTKTGTGLSVFATSPTFTTGILLAGSTSGNVTLSSDALSNTGLGVNLSGTGTIPFIQHIFVRSDETLSNSNADQNLFTNTAHDVITVQANTTYYFYGSFDLTHLSTSHSLALGFTPTTATVTNISYNTTTWVSAVGTATSAQYTNRIKVTTTTAVNAAAANGTEAVQFEGWITIGNTGGTITPQIKFSADPTGTILLKAGAEFHIYPVGNDTFTELGNIN